MKKYFTGMALNIIGAIILLLVLFGSIVSMLGYISFTKTFTSEYSETTYRMADTAASFINGDHLDAYLAGELPAEYEKTSRTLGIFTEKMNVTMVYVIKVDRTDYGRFVSIFNPVNNAVDDSNYTEWELGHKRDTTNAEYRMKYRALYELQADYETVFRTNPTDGQKPHITTMVPVKTSSGAVSAILCIQRPISELDAVRQRFLAEIAVLAVALALISSLLAAHHIRRHFVTPVEKISGEAARFAAENTKGEPLGEISQIDEISDLAHAIDKMESDMVQYIDNLTAITSERERIGAELSLARRIQASAIPNVFPAFPDRTEFDVFASMTPAKAVGGDFYNFFLIDDDHLAMMIGDVSGKGIPAALFMMVTNILLSVRSRQGGTPAEILSSVNDYVCARDHADMFVTLWLGILEISSGRLVAASAGHEYPAIKEGPQFRLLKDRHGLVMGGMEGVVYTDYELRLQPGDKLFVYTDGVPEATDAENRMFGCERMLDTLCAAPDSAPEQILQNMRAAVDAFVQGAEQFDDLTMICLEYKGK